MNTLSRIIHRFRSNYRIEDIGREQPASWYDMMYRKKNTPYYHHYTEFIDYFLWTVVVDRIPSTASLLEIGCGPAQLATYLHERGIARYIGFDFSEQAIQVAKANLPSAELYVADALKTDLLERPDYDTVLCTEVLEHIESDLEVVARIRPQVRCLLTVPSFPYPSHVRWFANAEEVMARYSPAFTSCHVTRIPKDAKGNCFYLLDGIKQ